MGAGRHALFEDFVENRSMQRRPSVHNLHRLPAVLAAVKHKILPQAKSDAISAAIVGGRDTIPSFLY
jgi:hypothetical protein